MGTSNLVDWNEFWKLQFMCLLCFHAWIECKYSQSSIMVCRWLVGTPDLSDWLHFWKMKHGHKGEHFDPLTHMKLRHKHWTPDRGPGRSLSPVQLNRGLFSSLVTQLCSRPYRFHCSTLKGCLVYLAAGLSTSPLPMYTLQEAGRK